jgi:hypothetical protein
MPTPDLATIRALKAPAFPETVNLVFQAAMSSVFKL